MHPKMMRGDRAENSIMQTISIAVSAILIAAGLITAPSLINNARDTNAKQDIAIIGNAQGFAQSDTGSYVSEVTALNRTGGTKIVLSGDAPSTSLISGTDCYGTFTKSVSGSFFYGSSNSSGAYKIPTTWPTVKPANYPANCAWPMSGDTAIAQTMGNLIPNSAATTAIGWQPRWFGGPSSVGAGTISVVTNDAPNGASALRKTWTAASPGGQDVGFNSPKGNVVAGQTYTGGGWIKSSIATAGNAFLSWYDSSGVSLGTSSFGPQVPMPVNTWARMIAPASVAPASAAFVDIIFGAYPSGGGNIPIGTTMDHTMAMVETGSTLHDYADGNTPGWTWDGAANASASHGKPYTIDSIAGAPVIDSSNPTKGTQYDNLFTSGHTSISVVDTTNDGQLGWLASDAGRDSPGNWRWEALNMNIGSKQYWARTYSSSTGSANVGHSFANANVGLDIVSAGLKPDGTGSLSVRGFPSVYLAGEAPQVSGYHLKSGVRDMTTAYGVAPARLIVYSGTLSDATRILVVRWLANHYGIEG